MYWKAAKKAAWLQLFCHSEHVCITFTLYAHERNRFAICVQIRVYFLNNTVCIHFAGNSLFPENWRKIFFSPPSAHIFFTKFSVSCIMSSHGFFERQIKINSQKQYLIFSSFRYPSRNIWFRQLKKSLEEISHRHFISSRFFCFLILSQLSLIRQLIQLCIQLHSDLFCLWFAYLCCIILYSGRFFGMLFHKIPSK